MTAQDPAQTADTVRLEIRARTYTETLRWMAQHLEEGGSVKGVAFALRMMADSLAEAQTDGHE
jgi:hypothetical protein